MVVTVSTDQPRTVKALAVLAGADQWIKAHRKADGSPCFIIPGSNGRVYLSDQTSCSCMDAVSRGVTCKHSYAVRMKNVMMRAGVSAPADLADIPPPVTRCRCGALLQLADVARGDICRACRVRDGSAEYERMMALEG